MNLSPFLLGCQFLIGHAGRKLDVNVITLHGVRFVLEYRDVQAGYIQAFFVSVPFALLSRNSFSKYALAK